MSCVTHHHACDCREVSFGKLQRRHDSLEGLMKRIMIFIQSECYCGDGKADFAPCEACIAVANIQKELSAA